MDRKVLLGRKEEAEGKVKFWKNELENIEKELKKPVVLIIPLHRGNTDFVDSQNGLAYNVKVSTSNNGKDFWLQTASGDKGLNICMSHKELEKVREAINIVLGD